MEVYIQGENSLIPIQEEVTAESIEEALGYTPADAEDIIECIEESDDSALYVTDKDGNIITRTDSDGFHASVMTVNGKDVESGLVTDEDRASWGGSDLDDVISKDDDSTLYITDKDGNIIAKIDKDGLHATEVYIRDETGEKTVADMIAALVGAAPETLNTLEELATAFKEHEEVAEALDEAITNRADATEFETHKADYEAHKTDYDSHKSAFATHKAEFESHKGDSTHFGDEIKLDDDENLYICDKDGNIIARFDGDGLDVTDLKVSSQPIDEYLSDIVENSGEACDHEYVTIQELIRDTTDCTTWKDLQYCSSCGKVHANLLHTEHTYGNWKVLLPVECEVDGIEERTCIRCDYAETQTIPAPGHDWDVEVEVVEPTCTTGGYTIHTCNECGDTYTDNETDPLGHDMVTVAAQAPTADSHGWDEHQKCSRCDYTEGYLARYLLTIEISITAYTDISTGMTTAGKVASLLDTAASEINATQTLVYRVTAQKTKSGYLSLKAQGTNCTCSLVCSDGKGELYTLTISNPTGAATVKISG